VSICSRSTLRYASDQLTLLIAQQFRVGLCAGSNGRFAAAAPFRADGCLCP
jgi:hypothetical protein